MKDLQNKKLIAFDLDGTLAESKQKMTPQMGELLGRLLEKYRAAVTSGGAFEQFKIALLSALPPTANKENLILLPVSGGAYYAFQNGLFQKVYDHSFTQKEKSDIQSALKKALEETSIGEGDEKIYGERIEDRGAQITFSGLGQEAPLEKKKLWDPDRKKRTQLIEIIAPKIPWASVRTGGTTSVDIVKEGVDKAFGIEEVSKRTGIPISDMVYIGDALYEGGNDEVVKRTGVDVVQVSGPEETEHIIRNILTS